MKLEAQMTDTLKIIAALVTQHVIPAIYYYTFKWTNLN